MRLIHTSLIVITVLLGIFNAAALDGTVMLIRRSVGEIVLYDMAAQQGRAIYTGGAEMKGCFSPDGREVAVRMGNGTIRIIRADGSGYRDLAVNEQQFWVPPNIWLHWLPDGHIYWIGGEGDGYNWWTDPYTSAYKVDVSTGAVTKVYTDTDKFPGDASFSRDGTRAYSCRRYDLTGVKPTAHFLGSCGPSISGSGRIISQTVPYHRTVQFYWYDSLEACCPDNQNVRCYGCGCWPDDMGCSNICADKA